MVNEYISLEALAAILGLPKMYLRRLANQGLIPYLDVGGRKRFIEGEVRKVLTEMSAIKNNAREGKNDY